MTETTAEPNARRVKLILFGATGMVGQGALLECLDDPEVERVLAVVRRPTGKTNDKLEELVLTDFTDYSGVEDRLLGYDACLFCLGVSAAGMAAAEYRRVTYDYTLAAAQALARLNPELTFCYVSGSGTDSTEKGRQMWARVKGKVENVDGHRAFGRDDLRRAEHVLAVAHEDDGARGVEPDDGRGRGDARERQRLAQAAVRRRAFAVVAVARDRDRDVARRRAAPAGAHVADVASRARVFVITRARRQGALARELRVATDARCVRGQRLPTTEADAHQLLRDEVKGSALIQRGRLRTARSDPRRPTDATPSGASSRPS